MSECRFKVGDLVKCVDFDGASGKRLLAWKGSDGVYQVTETKDEGRDSAYRDSVYLDNDPNNLRAVFASRFVLVDPPHIPMESDSLEDILAEQELYAKLEGER